VAWLDRICELDDLLGGNTFMLRACPPLSINREDAVSMIHNGSPATVEVSPCGTSRVLFDAGLYTPEVRPEACFGDALLINSSVSAEASFMR
jgi:hypothetical protein